MVSGRVQVWFIAGLSGLAGLGYEMVWTRAFGVVLGTEMEAVLGAIAALFAGLALGAWWWDERIAQSRRPARLYALLEVVIGLWGCICILLLPSLSRWVPPLLGTHPSQLTLAVVVFLLPAVALLPATIAMGGTLAALARLLEQQAGAERAAAGAYAANTFGAVLGTYFTVTALFGLFGLRGTLGSLALCNLLAAALALRLESRHSPLAAGDTRRAGTAQVRVLVTIAVTGFLGIGVEVLVVRVAAQFLSDTIYTFAGLLVAYLLGSAIGGACRQRLRWEPSEHTHGILLCATSVAVLATVAALPMIAGWVQRAAITDRLGESLASLVIFLPSSFLMGGLYADLLERYRAIHGTVGRANAVNAAGAALAPAMVALVLIPLLGSMVSLVVLASLYLLLLPLRRGSLGLGCVPALVAGALLLFPPALPKSLPAGGRQVASIEGPMVAASVLDDAQGARYLEVNGHLRMGGTNSERSDFRQGLLPALLHGSPKRALYLGVGTGATLSGALLYPGLSVHGVEIAEEVVDLLPYFRLPGRPDPGPAVLNADARRFIAADSSRYDLIVADNFHPALEGSGSLYTREHYVAVKRRLAPEGLFCQWLPLYQLDRTSLRDIVRTYLAVFPDASAWLAHLSVRMPMLALCGSADGRALHLSDLTVRLRQPGLSAVLTPIELASPLAVLGTYLGSAERLRRYAGSGDLNTDDHPIVALNAQGNVNALSAPVQDRVLDLVANVAQDSPPWEIDGMEPIRVRQYLRARNRFLIAGAELKGNPLGRALIDAAVPGLLATIQESAEFEPAYQPLLQMADALAAAEPAAAATLLRRIDAAAPTRTEARERLDRLLRQMPGL